MKEIDRILGILLALQSHRRISARQLAERFHVSTRTIYRDLQTMSLLGIPVYAERGRNGGIRLLEGYFLPPLMFSRGEAIALLLGVIMLRTLRAVPFQAEVHTAAQKLLAAVPDDLRATLARLSEIIGAEVAPADIFHGEPDEPAVVGDADRVGITVTSFLQAILAGNDVRLTYQSPYREDAFTVDAHPLGIFWDRGRWYLVTHEIHESGAARDQRTWRADRVTNISHSGTSHEGGTTFDVGDMLGHAWLRSAMTVWRERAPVRLRVTADQAERLQGDWYYRFAQYETDPDGRVTVSFGERDAELVLALVRWLGPGAELLSPTSWRTTLRDQLEAMLRQIDDGGRP